MRAMRTLRLTKLISIRMRAAWRGVSLLVAGRGICGERGGRGRLGRGSRAVAATDSATGVSVRQRLRSSASHFGQ